MRKLFGIMLLIAIPFSMIFFIYMQSRSEKKIPVKPIITPTQGPAKIQSNDEILLGEITKIDGRHFFLMVNEKEYNIVLSDHTYFKKRGKEALKVGLKLGVVASPDEDGTHIARTIVINASTSAELQ